VTVGEIYVSGKKETPAGPAPSLSEDLREIGTSFAEAGKNAFTNVFSTAGIKSLQAEEEEGQTGLRSVVSKTFTPLSAYAFMAFVLLFRSLWKKKGYCPGSR
jgi:ferrous iron transport protein B